MSDTWEKAYAMVFKEFCIQKDENAKVQIENAKLQTELNATKELLKKVGVITYLRCKVEIYELVLSSFAPGANLRQLNSEPPDLQSISLDLNDATVKTTYNLHFNRWHNILYCSTDPRRTRIVQELHSLGFQTPDHFCKYVAVLSVHLSNILHDFPPNVVNWDNEDQVVSALEQWQIKDTTELNVCRFLYRLPRLQ